MKVFMPALISLLCRRLCVATAGAAAPREPEEIWQELLKLMPQR